MIKEKKRFPKINRKKRAIWFNTRTFSMLKHNKKWWLTPIVLVLLLFGLLIILGGSTYAPFIYTLF